MKKFNFFAVAIAFVFSLVACEDSYDSLPGNNMEDSLSSVRIYPAPAQRVAGVDAENVALRGHAFAQSTFFGYSPNNINDSSTNTTVGGPFSWSNIYKYGPDGYLPQWVDLRFDSPVTFDFLRLFTSYGYEMKDWTMMVLDSSTMQWTTIGVVRNNIHTMRYFSFNEPITADVVRILCEAGPARQSGYARINELELYDLNSGN